jgi:hypothetical protein
LIPRIDAERLRVRQTFFDQARRLFRGDCLIDTAHRCRTFESSSPNFDQTLAALSQLRRLRGHSTPISYASVICVVCHTVQRPHLISYAAAHVSLSNEDTESSTRPRTWSNPRCPRCQNDNYGARNSKPKTSQPHRLILIYTSSSHQ